MKKILTFISLVILVLGVQAAGGIILMKVFHGWEERAAFGEMFIVVHALFDGLAFAALVFTLLVQDREIAKQKLIQADLVAIGAISARLNAENSLLYSQNRELDRLVAVRGPSTTQLEIIRQSEEEIKMLLAELDSFANRSKLSIISPGEQQ